MAEGIKDLTRALEAIIEPVLSGLGFALVRVIVSGRERPVVQVMAEPTDGRPMTVDDCAEISRVLSAKLDVEDPIDRTYTLEVSSPGIDRPLVRPADYARFTGFAARIEMKEPVDGRRRFSGRILGADDTHVRVLVDTGEVELPFVEILRAKLMLTDDLIAAATAAQGPLKPPAGA